MKRNRSNRSSSPPPSRSPPSRSPPSRSPPSRSHKRAKHQPDSEIILNLLSLVSKINLISDNSRYSFILQGNIPKSPAVCIDGVNVSTFCMKITFVSDKQIPESYEYIHAHKLIYKNTISVNEIKKEAAIQRKLYDSFTAPFVPRVFGDGIFSNTDFTNLFDKLLKEPSIIIPKGSETFTVVSSIVELAKSNPTWYVNIFAMEYIGKPYATLSDRSFASSTFGSPVFKPTHINVGYQRMAASLACVAGVGVILYDSHNNNGLINREKTKVVLLDVCDAFDVTKNSDMTKMKDIFVAMISGGNEHLISGLCAFFGVEKQSELKDKFVTNLAFTDFRKSAEINIRDIHHSLMMVAFVDFMVHTQRSMHISGIRCRYVMESVYGENSFKTVDNVGTFLTTFTPNLTSHAYDEGLTAVARFIKDIITPSTSSAPPDSQCAIQGGKRKNKNKSKRKNKSTCTCNNRKTKQCRTMS